MGLNEESFKLPVMMYMNVLGYQTLTPWVS